MTRRLTIAFTFLLVFSSLSCSRPETPVENETWLRERSLARLAQMEGTVALDGLELPGAGGALPEGGRCVRREHQVGGRGVVAEGAAGDSSAGVDAELQAGARLGVVAVEDAEVGDVGGGDLGNGLGKDGKDFKDGKDGPPGGR